MIEWGAPENLKWLWLLPAVTVAFYVASARKRSAIARFGELALIQKLVSSFDPAKRAVKRACLLAAILCIVAALVQPHFRKKETLVERRGIDVIIAVDVSKSMLAKDVTPSRLEKAKLELSGLIDKLKGDRIGIVAFAGDAYIQCPLTLDRGAAKLFLSTLSPNLVPVPGTVLTRAIKTSVRAFSEKDKGSKAVILLTDGEDQEPGAVAAARQAAAANVRIFTIGVGTPDGTTLPGEQGGVKKDSSGNIVISKLNESLLKEIASATGGVYYRSSRGEVEADRIGAEVRRMADKGLNNEWSVEYEESYQYFLLFAFALLLLEMGLSEKRSEPRGPTRPSAHAAALLVILLPFWCGFKFFSPLKNEKGNAYYKKGQVGKAKEAYLSASQSNPTSPEIAFNLGNAYYKEESYRDSLESYKKAAGEELSPGVQSKAFYNLGNGLVRSGQYEKAVDFYKQALRLNPKDQDAKFNLELLTQRLEEEKKDPEKKKEREKEQQEQQKNEEQKQEQQQQQNKDQQNQGQNQKQENKEQKSDQQNQGQKQDQQKEQGQEGQEGQNQEQQKEDGKPQESQGQSEEKKDEQQKQDKQQGEGQESQDKTQGEEQQSEAEQKQEQKSEQEQGEGRQGQEQQKEDRQEQAGEEDPGSEGSQQEAGQGEKSETQGKEQRPKSDAELRAEQILNAIESHEKQTLRMQSTQRNPQAARRYTEKDW